MRGQIRVHSGKAPSKPSKMDNCKDVTQYLSSKTAYTLKTPHVVFLSCFLGSASSSILAARLHQYIVHVVRRNAIEITKNVFFTLLPWPMTLTYKLDLDLLPLDLPAKIQVCMSVHSTVTVRRADGRTDRQTDDAKTITPITSEMWGVKSNIHLIANHITGGTVPIFIIIQCYIFRLIYRRY